MVISHTHTHTHTQRERERERETKFVYLPILGFASDILPTFDKILLPHEHTERE